MKDCLAGIRTFEYNLFEYYENQLYTILFMLFASVFGFECRCTDGAFVFYGNRIVQ